MKGRAVSGWAPGDAAGPSPCDDCELARRCRARLEACEAFGKYLDGKRWRTAAREPRGEIYGKLLGVRV